jgi:hypothetical protein
MVYDCDKPLYDLSQSILVGAGNLRSSPLWGRSGFALPRTPPFKLVSQASGLADKIDSITQQLYKRHYITENEQNCRN